MKTVRILVGALVLVSVSVSAAVAVAVAVSAALLSCLQQSERTAIEQNSPQPKQSRITKPQIRTPIPPLQRTAQNNRQRTSILARISNMLSAPPLRSHHHPPSTSTSTSTTRTSQTPLHPQILDNALPEPDQTGYSYKDRNNVSAPAPPIRDCSTMPPSKSHAHCNEQIAEDFRVGCEYIRHEYVAELAIPCFRDPTDTYTPQDSTEAFTPGYCDARWDYECECEAQVEEVQVWDDFPCCDCGGAEAGEEPEEG